MAPVTNPRIVAPVIMEQLQFPDPRGTQSDAKPVSGDADVSNPPASVSVSKRSLPS